MIRVLCLLLLLALPCAGAEPPMPTANRESPPGLEGLVWNKWDTPNFIVISLDRGQGSSMRSEAESLRRSLLERWSLKGSDRECKLVCVPDAVMLKRLFGLSGPRCEVTKNSQGEFRAAIWLDVGRKHLLSSLIAEAELQSSAYKSFAARGVPALERSPEDVRALLLSAKEIPVDLLFGSSDKVDPSDLAGNSALLCLLLRKEFGAQAFGRAAESAEPWSEVGFSSKEAFVATFARYRTNLSSDLGSGRTPDGYLGARP